MAQNRYKAIFFDLDGTLLPMDVEWFLKGYFEVLGGFATEYGYEPESFCHAVGTSVSAMAYHEPGVLNSDMFWKRFAQEWPGAGVREELFFEEFYNRAFGEIGAGLPANPAAPRAINCLREKGYPLYLCTMPLFPRAGVEWRLRWAGVDPSAFKLITTYDNSTAAKPSLHYYQENVERAGVAPEDILMVGNNTEEDMVAAMLGMDVYLVTDCLINPNNFDVATVRNGSLDDFAAFAESLPACETQEEA